MYNVGYDNVVSKHKKINCHPFLLKSLLLNLKLLLFLAVIKTIDHNITYVTSIIGGNYARIN